MGRKGQMKKNRDDYQIRRERNNVAVKKSREKARARKAETEKKVKELREQNKILEKKLRKLKNEISMYRNVLKNVDVTNLPDYLQTEFMSQLQEENLELSDQDDVYASNAEQTLLNINAATDDFYM